MDKKRGKNKSLNKKLVYLIILVAILVLAFILIIFNLIYPKILGKFIEPQVLRTLSGGSELTLCPDGQTKIEATGTYTYSCNLEITGGCSREFGEIKDENKYCYEDNRICCKKRVSTDDGS